MTRPPTVKNKTGNLVFKPVTPEDHKLSEDFKRLCIQDGVQVHDLLLEGIKAVFKAHHWPPGNPQLQLGVFADGKKPKLTLGRCGFRGCTRKAVASGFNVPRGRAVSLCALHYGVVKGDEMNWKNVREAV